MIVTFFQSGNFYKKFNPQMPYMRLLDFTIFLHFTFYKTLHANFRETKICIKVSISANNFAKSKLRTYMDTGCYVITAI